MSTIMSTGEKQRTQDRHGNALCEHNMCASASAVCPLNITYLDGHGRGPKK